MPFFFSRPVGSVVCLCFCLGISASATPKLTPAVAGPYRVSGSRIFDAHGEEYLLRGTRLAPVTGAASDLTGAPGEFGPLSATTIVTIRQRVNMNTVRLPLDAAQYLDRKAYRDIARTVAETSNRLELLVVLEASTDSPAFWTALAKDFRDNPNVFFALPRNLSSGKSRRAFEVIRNAGAAQPVVVGVRDLRGRNLVVEVEPKYAARPEDLAKFARLAESVPVLADGMDPEFFTGSAECRAFPEDPASAAELLEKRLAFFDEHKISWTISSFQPGRMISDYRYLIGTRLEGGWGCGGKRDLAVGIGVAVLSHLWDTSPTGLFPVNCMLGGFAVARGAVVSTYGRTLADRLEQHRPGEYPTQLGGVSIRITDSKGVARLAPMLYAGGGWAIISFVVPDESALGPAAVTIVRDDGSQTEGRIVVTDLGPGLWTKNAESRGEVNGRVTQRFDNGEVREFDATACDAHGCRTVPIPVSEHVKTTVRMLGTGFRFTKANPRIQVMIGGRSVPVLSFGPAASSEPGQDPFNDQLTVEIPADLKGAGEVDLWFTVDGVLSNVVRLNIGA